MAENIADTTVKNENSSETINWEERAKKAEAKIVEMKKQDEEQAPKEVNEEPAEPKEAYTKEDLDDAVKKAVKEYHIQAKEQEYENNINETNSSSIGWEDTVAQKGFEPISADEYVKLSEKEKDDYRAECLSNLWELTVL